MKPRLVIRPVLAGLAAATLSACGQAGADPHRFESMAEAVAAIPLEGEGGATPVREPVRAELRPALKVEVMDPHALWDARDGGLGAAAEQQAPRLVAAAAPVAAGTLLRTVSTRVESAAADAGLRPARPAETPRPASGVIQIGAYSSEAAAREAWARLASGGAAWALDGLTPVFEGVDVGGRRLTRLKVRVPAAGAAAVCAAAGVDDPWCHRAG